MPCDTPPPPPLMEDIALGNDDDYEEEADEQSEENSDPDDSMYEVIDMDELDEMPEDDAVITFRGHRDAVFCCNFDRTGHFVVTGGQDEKAFVWSVLNRSIKFECTGHTDSVIATNFSPDSNYVSTADMNGLIQVWNVSDGTMHWNFDTFEITWSEWLRGSNTLLAGSVDGNCWKWDFPDGTSTVFEHVGTGCNIGCISNNDEKLVTGYQDGTLKFWDVPNHKLLNTLSTSTGHRANVTSVKFSVDGSLILTGSEDGTAKVIKASDFKVLWTVNGCDSSHENVSVESVGFCHTLSYIVTGTNCGCLCIWDLQTKTRRNNIEVESAIIKIICDEFVPILYAAIGDGMLQAYDIRTGNVMKQWEGHKASLFDLAISSDRSLFLTASEDHTCKIFERGIL